MRSKYDSHLENLRHYSSLPEAFLAATKVDPARTCIMQANPKGEPRAYSFHEVASLSTRLSRYLQSLGVQLGDRIAILSSSRPEWLFSDLAILMAGATSVAIYQSLTEQDVAYILYDSGARIVFAENREQVSKLLSILSQTFTIPATEDRENCRTEIPLVKIITYEKVDPHPLIVPFSEIIADQKLSDAAYILPAYPETASLVYTSGTTGPPKGVIQTHGNHLANLWQAQRTGLFAPEGKIFLFLPLAHSFARLIGYIGLFTPTVVVLPSVADHNTSHLNVPSILRDLRESNCEVVPMVPRILEKLQDGVTEKTHRRGLMPALLRLTFSSSMAVYKGEATTADWITYAVTTPLRRMIKTKLFGTLFEHCVSGGAKLPTEVSHFFRSLGIELYEGYGLTETCVATNVNRIGRNKVGSVGPCLDDVEVQIAGDGEILFRGPNVAKGYYGRPTATGSSWDSDGWFHTGDIGRIDQDGFLFIEGRKKDIIVTSGGKKISPQAIEEKLTTCGLISHAVLVGDGRPFCVALIFVQRDLAQNWAAERNIALPEDLNGVEELRAEIQAQIDSVNRTLSRFETVKRFLLLTDNLSIENGLMTPTFKIKRRAVMEKFAAAIAELYKHQSDAR